MLQQVHQRGGMFGARAGGLLGRCLRCARAGVLRRPLTATTVAAPCVRTLSSLVPAVKSIELEPDKTRKQKKELKDATSRLKHIRMSPWKLNLLTRQIMGLPVSEAMAQLKFSRKQKGAPIVARVVKNASNLGNIHHKLFPENMKVAEAFVNRGNIVKGIMIMGRGRFGMKRRVYAHVIIRVQEIDFDQEIRDAKNRYARIRWEKRKDLAERVRTARDGAKPTMAYA